MFTLFISGTSGTSATYPGTHDMCIVLIGNYMPLNYNNPQVCKFVERNLDDIFRSYSMATEKASSQ